MEKEDLLVIVVIRLHFLQVTVEEKENPLDDQIVEVVVLDEIVADPRENHLDDQIVADPRDLLQDHYFKILFLTRNQREVVIEEENSNFIISILLLSRRIF